MLALVTVLSWILAPAGLLLALRPAERAWRRFSTERRERRYRVWGRLAMRLAGPGASNQEKLLAAGFVAASEGRGTAAEFAELRAALAAHLDTPGGDAAAEFGLRRPRVAPAPLASSGP